MNIMTRTLISDLKNKVEKPVLICGWIDNRRDHGKLVFFDIRDISGKIQAVLLPDKKDIPENTGAIRADWVLEAEGMVHKRPEKMVNRDAENGDIELEITKIKILNPADTAPFDTSTVGYEVNETERLKYRYLDLRRPRLARNIRMRHKVITFIRNFLNERGFTEIETPILSKSTPEGARDYLVPSRLETGSFYALPQSPQQYKQLLMVSGFERYYQVARCMRDEDTRGDRQPEFTQLDMEMSFVTQEDIMLLAEELFTTLVKELFPEKRIQEKPWPRLDYKDVMERYGTDRPDLRKDKNDPNELAFAWVLNFPLFETEKKSEHYAPSHHMFTAPKTEDIEKLDTDPASVRAYQHDLVLNGSEVGGGSIRIHDAKLQEKIFDLIGFREEEKSRFSHMLEAFRYGVPPHGGIAPGLDRLLMILLNEPNIREVIAFPKTGEGRDLMMEAPSLADEAQLKELGLEIRKKK